MTAAKETAQAASNNAVLAESPTEAEPYVEMAKSNTEVFKTAQHEYAQFVDIWKGTCKRCDFGA